MFRFNTKMKMLLYFICIVFSYTGCTEMERESSVSENDINAGGDVEEESKSMVSENAIPSIDYDDYLRKTWVVENWKFPDAPLAYSFYFTRIEDHIVEGKFKVGYDDQMALPDFYAYGWQSRLGDIAGIIQDGEMRGVFIETGDYENIGENGNLTIKFIDEGNLEVTIDYLGEENIYGRELVDETLHYIPYNISQYEESIDPDETRKYPVDFDSWGKVNFTMLWKRSANNGGVGKAYRMCFLTDEQDNILYKFAFLSDWIDFQNVVIEDLNGDGLKDIKIWEDLDNITFEWFQGEDGLFYNSFLDPNDHSIDYYLDSNF